ncbi:uncharacterized protein FOMMEDRAFT_148537 [Fomitiporia mediterranea MF3/22]|uniref:uncharacterized protein n=1 Tax=Fomitiporia mediterranea (strain MF3/22) TaxID=694068 RepID=UPI00044082D8|nr:uncharacterized protein FOMMEDRAFT_148537 [Fomitiporia mediterranea MF3/22]EJC99616.1 hypothetical protein FOMMEDRAFT_148537 [Fomitiporia mediterranea MF3/22]
MSQAEPTKDVRLERTRLAGMILGAVSYGCYAILTIQTSSALLRNKRYAENTHMRKVFLFYIAVTFVLATIGFSGNVKYTEMIWIDLRDSPGGTTSLINLEMDYWINRMALASYYVMEWFMEILLLHRCFVIWGWNVYILLLMTTLFLASVAMAILVLTESEGAVFYNISVQLAYLCIAVGMNIIYTILVVGRLIYIRNNVRDVIGADHARLYVSLAAMFVESAAMYSTVGVIYIVAFSAHSDVSNLVFLSISHVQGIAQLLIILRVARNRAFPSSIASNPSRPTSIAFASRSLYPTALTGLQALPVSSDEQATSTTQEV